MKLTSPYSIAFTLLSLIIISSITTVALAQKQSRVSLVVTPANTGTPRTTLSRARHFPTSNNDDTNIKKVRRSFRVPELPLVLLTAQKLLVGGASRSIAQTILYPVDALRTLAQTRNGRTLADLGAKSLTKGCLTTSSFALFQGALQFGIFDACRDRVGPVAASALGAVGSLVVSVPQEVVKQRLITGVYSSFRDAVATIYNKQGVAGFYSCWRPTMSRNVPFVIITFTTMDALKQQRLSKRLKTTKVTTQEQQRTEQELSIVENVSIGMLSAFVAATVTNPVDVVKTRMMTQAASNSVPYSSAMDCFKTVLYIEGPATFYAGFKQRSVYMCGLWGITFALNGQFNKAMDNRNKAG